MQLPEISIRSHSSDQFALDKVLYSNSYRLNRFLENSVVLDIGAGAGAFSIVSILHGAKKVYAFEPSAWSHEILVKNLRNFSKDFSTYQIGIKETSEFAYLKKPELVNNAFYNFSDVSIAGPDDQKGELCYFSTLDEIIKALKEKIYLLKISAPSKEVELLKLSHCLFAVENLCFEFKCSPSESDEIVDLIKKKGGFLNGVSEKISEQNDRLFMFSKAQLDICFAKYRTM